MEAVDESATGSVNLLSGRAGRASARDELGELVRGCGWRGELQGYTMITSALHIPVDRALPQGGRQGLCPH